jgi:hypothetical protein
MRRAFALDIYIYIYIAYIITSPNIISMKNILNITHKEREKESARVLV